MAKYEKPSGPSFTLREQITNQVLGDQSLPCPAFTSIYYPYGGYVVMRDGWDVSSHCGFMKTSRASVAGHFREGGNGLVISAFGEYLLVNSSAKAYAKHGAFRSIIFIVLCRRILISVDGYSQLINQAAR